MAENQAPKAPLLDLDTLVSRPKVRIDGELYEILSPNELSVLDCQRIMQWGREIDRLSKAGDQDAELERTVDTVARKVLVGVPEAIWSKLSGFHKMQVAMVFSGLLLGRMIGPVGALAATLNGSTGESSSLGSSASSAGNRGGGSKKPRRRS